VTRLFASLATFFRRHRSDLVKAAFVNDLPGFVTREARR